MAGHVSVPLYPTLTPETIAQILGHSETRLIFIGKLDGFKAMEPGIPKGLPRVSACGRDELAKEPWRFSPDVYVSIGAPEGPRRQQ